MGGGRLPITSYLSNGVLNRLKHFEFNALRTAIPELANNLPSDALYSGEGSEPERNQEVLQSWDALKNALSGINGDIHSRLRIMNARLSAANALYDRIAATPIRLRPESSREHLEPILEGLRQFCNLAEIEFPVQ